MVPVDKQFAAAVILILLGLGIMQFDQGDETFFSGMGLGTIVIASVWIAIRIIKEFKK